MSMIALVIGSLLLFLGIKLSLLAQQYHLLGFREEGRRMGEVAVTLAIVGFVLWTAGTPSPEDVLSVDPDVFWQQ
jgi:hypothetical protein